MTSTIRWDRDADGIVTLTLDDPEQSGQHHERARTPPSMARPSTGWRPRRTTSPASSSPAPRRPSSPAAT